MQTLYFEPAWDRTIAPADREKVMDHFQSRHPENDIQLSFLWEAINHKEERLITVLIHNGKDTPLPLQDVVIAYDKEGKQIATGIFTLPLKIPGKTSMPWTFIFTPVNQSEVSPRYTIINKS
ncbi:SLAP domain-containing protein [Sporosarcina sp. Marseille-Q4063]|uniref:SLAP domain-containing protein n=1 Tax=Sporosarcina sp. Marseille-Q4063 TaxID=2810514 RepID=UPI001BB005DA|nr:SLAP domain-containing protein [Sporosarcina sp. Marseille-Q4063]QUW22959.1 SLAP domain-containing protein [Sporosarcina sp. Marseille-Q4063]